MTLETAELRRRRRHHETQRAILEAAGSILVEDGYEHFTMRKLANRCGYTAPTIYNHFGDKTGLIDAVLEEVFRELVVVLERVQPAADPLDRLRAQFDAFVDFALRNPTHYRLLTTPRHEASEPPPSGEQARALLEEPLQALAESGRLRVDDTVSVQQSFWVLLHGLISLQTNRPDYAWSESLVEISLEAMIDGLVCREQVLSEAKEKTA
ncbi:MAG: TetR/AcrR family transcriptional regulator [Myxococcota bacterium]